MRLHLMIIILLLSVIEIAAPFASAAQLEPISDESFESLVQQLKHVPLTMPVSETLIERDNGCVYAQAEIPVFDPNVRKARMQGLYIARPDTKKPAPVILMVPTIHGRTILENRVATTLCEAGIAAVVADVNAIVQPETLPSWESEDANHRYALHALQTAVDFIQMHPNLDHKKIGAMGFSLGGITTAMLIGIEPRFVGAMIAAGGGNFPELLTRTKNRHMVRLRERRMEFLKLPSMDDYEQELHKHLVFDPLHFARRVNKTALLMMMVTNDRQVPSPNQKQLWETLGQPDVILLDQGHVASIVRLAYTRMDEVIAFFNERFKLLISVRTKLN
jgi:dienelactone hydrolase